MDKKIVYYPFLPPLTDPAAVKVRDVRAWVEDFMLPAGLATTDERRANAYLVAGGDGWLMRAVRRKFQKGKVIFGVNRGTLGFLLNPVSDISDLPRTFDEINQVTVRLIQAVFLRRDLKLKKYLAFNDVFCGGNVADFITFRITGSLGHFPAREVQGNAVVISTPQGTTGFALNNRGSAALLPLDSNHWFVSGMGTGPYPSDIVTPQHITVEVESRRPVNGYADGYAQEVKDILKMVISPTDFTVTLGFLKGIDFAYRRTELAQRVERGKRL